MAVRMTRGGDVQALIAHHLIGGIESARELGDVTLHPHQVEGARRARHLLETFGGALVADDVGLGKTFVALAVASAYGNTVVVVPAALRDTWDQAARRARVNVRIEALEGLARTASFRRDRGRTNAAGDPREAPDLVVVDEAHHLRNPATRTFAAVRALCTTSKVLLLSATPVQNRVTDLRTIVSLFLGARAHALSMDDLSALVIRRATGDVSQPEAPPVALEPEWLRPDEDVDCLDRMLALPPPVLPADGADGADGGDGSALLTYTLVRQWASSRAALRGALARRLARARALEDALRDGRLPTRAELAQWVLADGWQQIAIPLLAAQSATPDAPRLLAQVHAHAAAVADLLDTLSAAPDPDRSRVALLAALLAAHPTRRIVAFSEFAVTIAALFRALAPRARVAMLTHAGGRVAGGRVTREELLRRFAPGARAATHKRDRVDLLLTTDVLSEGVNLQDASIVVHLDLPWNPARLSQRVGRVRRIGSPERSVLVFAMAPPAPAERLLTVQDRLRAKLGAAARTIGLAGPWPLPGTAAAAVTDVSPVVRGERTAALLNAWRSRFEPSAEPVCGAVRATRHGAIVCVRLDGRPRLVSCLADIADDRALTEALIAAASGESVPVDAAAAQTVRKLAVAWLGRRRVTDVIDLSARRVALARRALLRRAEAIARRTPRHAQPAMTSLLNVARSTAAATLPAGAERVLNELIRAPLPDHAWLCALGEFAAIHGVNGHAGEDEVLAILLLVPPQADDPPTPPRNDRGLRPGASTMSSPQESPHESSLSL